MMRQAAEASHIQHVRTAPLREERWAVYTAGHTFKLHSCTNSRSPHKSNCSVALLRASRVHMVYPPSCCSLPRVCGSQHTHTLMLGILTAVKLHR